MKRSGRALDPPEGFREAEKTDTKYKARLDGEETLGDLLGMTPFGCRVPETAKNRLFGSGLRDVTVDVRAVLLKLE